MPPIIPPRGRQFATTPGGKPSLRAPTNAPTPTLPVTPPVGGGSVTADSVSVTADNTTFTADKAA